MKPYSEVNRFKNFKSKVHHDMVKFKSIGEELKSLLGDVKTSLEPQLLSDILTNRNVRINFFSNKANFDKFFDVTYSIYPRKYAQTLMIYLDRLNQTGLTESETHILHKIIELPIYSRFFFPPHKVKNRLNQLIADNESLQKICEIVVGYFSFLTELIKKNNHKLTLKELSYNNRPGFLSILLVGEPGCGKSWIGQLIADVLRIPCLTIDCSSNDYLGVSGSASNWSNSKEGIITKTLIDEGRFPFIVIFDEVDKSGHSNENYLIDTINHLIDPSKIFIDPYLNVPLYHIKSFIFILTANDESKIPSYIKSRVYKIYVKPSKPEVIVDGVIRNFMRDFGIFAVDMDFKFDGEMREMLVEFLRVKKYDFRALRVFLNALCMIYYSPWNDQKNFKSFFNEQLKKEIDSSDRNLRPEIGFMRG